jgi:MYXO-CTERM domain-containing protein
VAWLGRSKAAVFDAGDFGEAVMRFSTIAIATALAAGLTTTGNAFAPHKGGERPVVAAGREPRLHRSTAWTTPATAQLGTLATWRAIWDRDTDVPLRMWGPSIPAPHAVADAAVADAAARDFLAAHLATLAPGAAASDFVLVANQVDGNIRTVGFKQQAHGLDVVGGAVGIIFERDHLVMVTSTALPNITVRMPIGPLAAGVARNAAIDWLAQDSIPVTVRGERGRVIVPVVHARGTKRAPDIEYRVAETIAVDAARGEAGRWDVWLDANDAAPIARQSTVMFASGTVNFDVPDRYPGGGRSPHPAPNALHTVDAVQVQSDLNGVVTWASATTSSVVPGLTGPLVAITNKAGAVVQAQPALTLAPGGAVTWSQAGDPATDAQLDAFVFASAAKHFVQTRMNPNTTATAWLGGQESVTVNEQMTCNAYSTGDDIHFFKADTQCENTGRIADVVYHEFGHSVHYNSIIQGVGAFDGSLSEGMADTLAVSITGDHGMGRGFFFNDQALRDVDPVGIEKKWPDDADGEVHDEGEIIGEALYDLRKALQTKYGDAAGFEVFLKLYYGVLQRAADIPSSYAAVLVADDDNGDLSDGTPDQCEIDAAMAPHGLSDPTQALGLAPPTRDGSTVSIKIKPPGVSSCPPPSVTSATLTWQLAKDGTPADIALALGGDGVTYSGVIPTQPDTSVVLYHVTVALSDGSSVSYPQNPADPDYQMYVGAVQPIRCFDFEGGLGDWTHSGSPASRDEWEVGTPLGIGGDPSSAHGGVNVLGIDLGDSANGDGQYRDGAKQWVLSPMIDLQGHTAVRLQYYRWLGVEDGAYDNAIISANGMELWTNHASPGMPTTEVNHVDKEWRFHDVDLSAAASTGMVQLKFELDSDPGLTFSGWNIDDVCVVAVTANAALCGNGTIDPGETCDDGNHTDGDGCSSSCAIEACPDSGGAGPCDGGGCCSATNDPAGPIALSTIVIGGLVIRRRRRR